MLGDRDGDAPLAPKRPPRPKREGVVHVPLHRCTGAIQSVYREVSPPLTHQYRGMTHGLGRNLAVPAENLAVPRWLAERLGERNPSPGGFGKIAGRPRNYGIEDNMAPVASAATATRWSLIVRAQGSGADVRVALGQLLGQYQKLVLWLIGHYGHPPDTTAEELKQEFLEGILRRNDIAKLDRERGSFRSWLGLAVRRFLMNEWDKWRSARAGRRGSSPAELESIELPAPADDVYMREFACNVVSHALSQQRAESRDVQRFDALARFLPGPQMDPVDLASLGATLGTTQNALAKAICLLRARFRELLREAIRDLLDLERDLDANADKATREAVRVASARAIDDELRELRQYFWS